MHSLPYNCQCNVMAKFYILNFLTQGSEGPFILSAGQQCTNTFSLLCCLTYIVTWLLLEIETLRTFHFCYLP